MIELIRKRSTNQLGSHRTRIRYGCDTDDVVFVADDLASWLIGLIADAGRKRLTTVLLGTDQDRAVRSAATAAVQLTASELSPDDDEQAEHVALVISQVFSKPMPDAQLTGRDTEDRHYAATDLLEVAEIEPRAVPADLAQKLERDHDKSVAAQAVKLLSAIKDAGEGGRGNSYGPFGM
jgi:hypothetical protein